MTRRADFCQRCGVEAEIAAHGLCYKCYRRAERTELAKDEARNPGQRTQKKMQRAYSTMQRALVVECGLSHNQADRLIRMISSRVKPLADYLGEKPPEDDECLGPEFTDGTDAEEGDGSAGASSQEPGGLWGVAGYGPVPDGQEPKPGERVVKLKAGERVIKIHVMDAIENPQPNVEAGGESRSQVGPVSDGALHARTEAQKDPPPVDATQAQQEPGGKDSPRKPEKGKKEKPPLRVRVDSYLTGVLTSRNPPGNRGCYQVKLDQTGEDILVYKRDFKLAQPGGDGLACFVPKRKT